MSDSFRQVVRFADLPSRKPTHITLVPDAEALAAVAERLELMGLRKMRFEVSLSPAGKADWHLKGDLGATVIQPCGVTLAPVTTRIEETVERIYLAAGLPAPDDAEAEMPDDDRLEALPSELDLAEVAFEALALALPAFPRAPGADLGEAVFTEPGKAAMTDEDARPFAGLADLKAKLGGAGTGDDG